MSISAKCCTAALGLLAAAAWLAATPSAHAAAWSSCAQYGSWTSGIYTVYTDAWNNGSGSECLSANSGTNWTATANYSGGGIKAYPNTSFTLNNVSLSSLSSVPTSFNFSVPGNAQWDVAYDVWSANDVDEIMIWEEWSNNSGPISYNYGCNGYPSTACPIATNVNIGGATYNVYRGNNGHNVVSFLRTSQRSSGSEDVLQFMKWTASDGVLVSATLSQVEFGVEITSTSGNENFTLNSFSGSINTGSSSGGGTSGGSYSNNLSGYHKLLPQNATSSCLDINAWGGNGAKVQIWKCSGGTNESFNFSNQGNGVYEIQPSYNTSLCLDMYNQGTTAGTIVQAWSCWGGAGQKWGAISDGGSIYEFAPQIATGLRLEVWNWGTANATQVDAWTATSGANQKWNVE